MTCGLAWAIADQNHASVDEKIFAIRAALRIIDTVCYDMPRAYFDSYFSAGFLRLLVQLRAENRLFDDTIYADIEAMIESARRADEEPLGRHFFKGNVFMDSVYYEHTISDCQTKFAKEALDEACFDPIRDSERFRELYKMTVGNFDLS